MSTSQPLSVVFAGFWLMMMQELSVTIRQSGTPESPMVTAYVTPTGEGEQPVQAINLHLTSYMNGRRIQRLLDFDTTEPQKCGSSLLSRLLPAPESGWTTLNMG